MPLPQPMDIDHIICAELPDPLQDPDLFQIISTPCILDDYCTKQYPKQLLQGTQTAPYGYPLHRRCKPEEGGFTTKINWVAAKKLKLITSWLSSTTNCCTKLLKPTSMWKHACHLEASNTFLNMWTTAQTWPSLAFNKGIAARSQALPALLLHLL